MHHGMAVILLSELSPFVLHLRYVCIFNYSSQFHFHSKSIHSLLANITYPSTRWDAHIIQCSLLASCEGC